MHCYPQQVTRGMTRNTMTNRLKIIALCCCLGAGLSTAAQAADSSAPQVSKNVVKQLKAANDAVQAKNLDVALEKLKEAQAAPGEKTPYDTFVINALLGPVYVQKQDYADAAPALQIAAESQYATPEQQKAWLRAVQSIYYQQKNWPKVVESGQEALKHGAPEGDTLTLIAQAQFLDNKFKDAAGTMQEVVSKQDRPDEKSLKFLWECYIKTNDDVDAAKVIDKLVTYYPKPDYWLNALAPLLRMDVKDEHLQLNIYRLMSDVGVLKLPTDYTDMAQLAMDQGYPGETVTTLQDAFAKNIYTDQRTKDRNQRLLDGAKKRADADESQLAQSEKDAAAAPTGDAFVQLGQAYESYGRYDKALQALQKGIAKGNLKYADDAQLAMGIAQLKLKNPADAQKNFEKVASSSNMGYARLGKLWDLHAKG
jgi:tetratricopeptide (TPR) repeat protein